MVKAMLLPGAPTLGTAAMPVALLLAVAACVGAASGEEPPAATARPIWADAQTNTLGAPSPDGRYLSFVDSAGNLAVRDLRTGAGRALTSTAGGPSPGQFAYFSIFSPDSSQVAYAWFNAEGFYELRLIALDGSEPRTLYRNPEAGFVQPTAFSSDGGRILTLLFRRDNVSQIALVSTSDGETQVLRSLDWFYPKKIDLSPDGRFVVYDSLPEGDSTARDIHILALDGSSQGQLTAGPANDLFPLWTPDGAAVLFGSDRGGGMDAWMLRVEDGRPVGDPVLVKRDLGRALPMAFTRGGRLFYGLRAGRSDVYVGRFNPADGAPAAAASALPSRFAGANRKPEWSPDGRFLAYLSRVGTENYGQEYRVVTVREWASNREAVLTPRLTFIERLRWSPDGASLLLSGSDAQGRAGLFTMDLKTGEARQAVVERSADFRGLEGDWSANGLRIYFAQRTASNRFAIRSHDLESGRREDVYQTPEGPAVIRSLRRARAADRLAFVLAAGPGGEMQSLQILDVGESRSVTLLQSRYGDISSLEWIADDEQLLVSSEAPGGSSLWVVSTSEAEPKRLDAPWKRPGPLRVGGPDGDRLAYSHEETKAEVWALENIPTVRQVPVRSRRK